MLPLSAMADKDSASLKLLPLWWWIVTLVALYSIL